MHMGDKHSDLKRKPTNNLISSLFWCSFAILLTPSAFSQVSVQLPSTISNGARDRIVTPERFECENSLSGKAQLEYGVAASNSATENVFNLPNTNQGKNVTIYGKLIVPIGGPKSRIDCNRLFDLEVRRRELELKLLEQQLRPELSGFRTGEVPTPQVQTPSSGSSSGAR